MKRSVFCLVCIGFVLLLPVATLAENTAAGTDTVTPGIPVHQTKTLLLCYLVATGKVITADSASALDLKDIAREYQNINPADVDVLVAFGGGETPGWQGMRVATIDQLREDAKDGKFGNGNYLYSDPEADMGTGKCFGTFLGIAEKAEQADRVVLIIAGHGGAYGGLGYNEVSDNLIRLTDYPGEAGSLDSALQSHAIRPDLVLLGACKMGAIETAKTFQPYSGILLTSEDNSYGRRNYTMVFRTLGANPGADSAALARALADDYIDGLGKDYDVAMTASVIDPAQVPAIQESLDELGAKLVPLTRDEGGLHDLKAAYNDAVSFGGGGGSPPTSVDLVSLLENIAKRRPELSFDVQKTVSLIRKAVIYERHNAASPPVCGLSIASPDNISPDKYRALGGAVKISPNWDEFFQAIIDVSTPPTGRNSVVSSAIIEVSSSAMTRDPGGAARGESPGRTLNADVSRRPQPQAVPGEPQFTGRGNGSCETGDTCPAVMNISPRWEEYLRAFIGALAPDANWIAKRAAPNADGFQPNVHTVLGKPGFIDRGNGTFELNDPYHSASVYGVYYHVNGSRVLAIGTEPITAGSDGLYRLPVWDGRWYYLTEPAHNTRPLLLAMTYDGDTSGGYGIYYSGISIRDRGQETNATLTAFVNTTSDRYTYSITPYLLSGKGDAIFGQSMDSIPTGSRLTAFTTGIDEKSGTERMYILSTMTAAPGMTLEYRMVPDGTYTSGIMAYYDNDAPVFTDEFRTITVWHGLVKA